MMQPRRVLRLAAAIGVWGAVLTTPALAQAPGVSITLSDGVTDVAEDAELTYTATLVNSGDAVIEGTVIVTIPPYATFVDAPDAVVSEHDASWEVAIEPGASVTKDLVVAVGTPPEGEEYLSTLASLYLGDPTGVPAVRTADANRLPGTTGPASGEVVPDPSAPEAEDDEDSSNAPVVLIALGCLAVVGGLLLVARRRNARGRNRSTPTPTDDAEVRADL